MKKTKLLLLVGTCLGIAGLFVFRPELSSTLSSLTSTGTSAANSAAPASILAGIPSDQEPTKEEIEKLAPAFEKLSAADKKTVLETVAYQNFLVKIRGLLEQKEVPRLSKEEVTDLSNQIDGFREQDYLIPYEAYQMKARLLSGAYAGAELDAKMAEIKNQFAAQYKALSDKSDPAKDPTMIAFKSAQNAMIQSTAQMTRFPDGLTRDQYIIRESEKIRGQYFK